MLKTGFALPPEPLELGHIAHNLTCCNVPGWIKRAAEDARNDAVLPCTCPSAAMAARAIQAEEPKTAGGAVPIPRVPAAQLSTADFFWHFAYRGLPVIVTESDHSEWWNETARKAVQCAEREHSDGQVEYAAHLKKGGDPKDEGCNTNDDWCPHNTYVVKRKECMASGSLDRRRACGAVRRSDCTVAVQRSHSDRVLHVGPYCTGGQIARACAHAWRAGVGERARPARACAEAAARHTEGAHLEDSTWLRLRHRARQGCVLSLC